MHCSLYLSILFSLNTLSYASAAFTRGAAAQNPAFTDEVGSLEYIIDRLTDINHYWADSDLEDDLQDEEYNYMAPEGAANVDFEHRHRDEFRAPRHRSDTSNIDYLQQFRPKSTTDLPRLQKAMKLAEAQLRQARGREHPQMHYSKSSASSSAMHRPDHHADYNSLETAPEYRSDCICSNSNDRDSNLQRTLIYEALHIKLPLERQRPCNRDPKSPSYKPRSRAKPKCHSQPPLYRKRPCGHEMRARHDRRVERDGCEST